MHHQDGYKRFSYRTNSHSSPYRRDTRKDAPFDSMRLDLPER
jgi:hypothetical protein